MTPAQRLARAIALLSGLPPDPTQDGIRTVQAARLELDLLLAQLWRRCPEWPGAGYVAEEEDNP